MKHTFTNFYACCKWMFTRGSSWTSYIRRRKAFDSGGKIIKNSWICNFTVCKIYSVNNTDILWTNGNWNATFRLSLVTFNDFSKSTSVCTARNPAFDLNFMKPFDLQNSYLIIKLHFWSNWFKLISLKFYFFREVFFSKAIYFYMNVCAINH